MNLTLVWFMNLTLVCSRVKIKINNSNFNHISFKVSNSTNKSKNFKIFARREQHT